MLTERLGRFTVHVRTVLILAVLVLGSCSPHSVDENQRRFNLGDEVMRLLQRHDEASLTQLFHYPPEESGENRYRDERGVRDSLLVMLTEFGAIADVKRIEMLPPSVYASVGSGNLTYWATHEKYWVIPYEVTFSNRGHGWVFVQVCEIGSNPELRAIVFALPSDSEDNREAVASTLVKLTEVVRPDGQESKR